MFFTLLSLFDLRGVMPQAPRPRQIDSTDAPIAPTPNRRFLVVIDAAHGGEDGGAQLSDHTPEKTVTLALSVRLRSLLMARGFQVSTTREGNLNLTGDQRAQMANHAQAAVCLSLHATEAGSGVHLFVSSLQPEESSRFLAWKTAQAAYVTRSLKLSSVVNSSLEHGSKDGTHGSEGAATGGSGADSGSNAETISDSDTPLGPIPTTLTRTTLPGVDSMTCPAVAVEIAPLRGDDRKVTTDVTDEQYQTRVVEDLAAAIFAWRTDWDSDLHPENRLEDRQQTSLEDKLEKQSGIKMDLIKPGVRPEVKLEMIGPGERPGVKPSKQPGKPGSSPPSVKLPTQPGTRPSGVGTPKPVGS